MKQWTGQDAELFQQSGWHSLILTVRGGTALTGSKIGGKQVYEGIDRAGALTFIPALADRQSWYIDADLDYAGLFIHPRAAEEIPALAELAALGPRVNASDALIEGMLGGLAREIEDGAEPELSFMDAFVSLIARQLARSDGRQPVHGGAGGPLSRRTLKTVAEYVSANVGRDIGLNALAEIADLSPDTFSRRFRASLGMAPSVYVQEQRVRHAAKLLIETDRTLSDIALACGFSSQSHLNRVFKQITGDSPGAYRKKG
ncbi:MAG: helix-turn-helix domain-containing protein [Pseudomonadota bacterium]